MRPIFLVIEVEQPEGLSSRKLVLETAKYNVVTAYSGKEGIETAVRVPVDAAVVHAGLEDIPCEVIVRQLKSITPGMPIVVVSPNAAGCEGADYVLSSYDPAALLEVLRQIVAKAS
ncbi:MAG: response regulator [Candidatus Korobacteraceae bacterium]